MNELGNKERILSILSKFESGLTYNDLLRQYKEQFGKELKNGYVYLKRLKENGLVRTYKPEDVKGKILNYRLLPEKVIHKKTKYLRFLNDFFKDNIDYLKENNEISEFVKKNAEIFNKIEEVIESY